MPPRQRYDPSKSRSLTVRLAHLRPSHRQQSKWQRDQSRLQLVRTGTIGFVALILLILGFGWARESFFRGREAVADVHGQVITLNELVERARPRSQAIDEQIRLYQAQGSGQQVSQLISQKNGLPDQVLDQMIEEIIVRHESDARGIAATDDEVERRIQEILAQQDALSAPAPTPTATPETPQPTVTPTATLSPSQTPAPTASATPYPTLVPEAAQSAYQNLLSRNGLTDAQLRELVRSDILEEKLRTAVGTDGPVAGPQVHVRHILLETREKADEVRQRLLDGADFGELARLESKDPGSRDNGGDLGWFGYGRMNLPFESAAFAQDPMVIGEVVESRNGFHVIQVLEGDDSRAFDQETIERQKADLWRNWISTAQVQPEVKNQLNPEKRDWIVRQLGGLRRV